MDLLYRFLGSAPIAAQYAAGAGFVLALALALTLGARRFALHFGLLAPIRERDVHTAPVPRLGGVAIYLAFVLGMLLLEPLGGARHGTLNRGLLVPDAHLLREFRGMLIGGTVAVLVGVIDDLVTLRPFPHFVGQILAAAAALATGLDTVRGISNPFSIHLFYAHPEKHLQILLTNPVILGVPILAVAFTTFWIVGMMNTVNFLDGLDGLAAGVVAIAAILLAIWSGRSHDVGVAPLLGSQVLVLPPLILAAALAGFLILNWAPARIFMGDSGAQFAGFTLGVLAILGPAKIGTALLILVIPILDIAWVFVRRPVQGRGFFSADKEHLHHRLLALGWSQQRIVLAVYGICIALGVIDLLLSRVFKLAAFVAVALITVVALARLTYAQPAETARRAPSVSTPAR